MAGSEPSIHRQHRQRLKKRFLTEGLDHFDSVNLLELILFYAIPQGDTNPIAHRLLVWEGMPVTEACFACGFNDVAYFCRTFRRYKGFPPSQAKAARSTNTTA